VQPSAGFGGRAELPSIPGWGVPGSRSMANSLELRVNGLPRGVNASLGTPLASRRERFENRFPAAPAAAN
jgi:hypothetical protein